MKVNPKHINWLEIFADFLDSVLMKISLHLWQLTNRDY